MNNRINVSIKLNIWVLFDDFGPFHIEFVKTSQI